LAPQGDPGVLALEEPWQNPYVERLIGTVRRECLDHVIVLGEGHLQRVLRGYVEYYQESRTHLGLGGECPVPRPVEPPANGPIRKRPMVGGLHHRYYRGGCLDAESRRGWNKW